MDEFLAKNLVKEPTCFMSPDNPSCIDLFITNSYRSFQKTTALSTGLSDFHKMVVTVLKTTFPKANPKVISYRDLSHYSEEEFGLDLKRNLETVNELDYDKFDDILKNTFNYHAPEKK